MIFVAVLCIALFSTTLVDAKNQPKIFAKGGSIYIRSGDEGNIVFEHSQQGKVLVGGLELNVTSSVGAKGEKGNDGNNGSKGAEGQKGDKGGYGSKGDIGETGQPGLQGYNGTTGLPGQKGDQGTRGLLGPPGINGTVGHPGDQGPRGSPGPPGINGTRGQPGPKGSNGTTGRAGPLGAKGDNGGTSFYRDSDSQKIICNSTNFGILRYFSTKLQLCTPKGWRYIAFEKNEVPQCSFPNAPQTNLEAFYGANLGIMFQFNREFLPWVNSENHNVTAEILPINSTLVYEEAVMREASRFSGNAYINVSGISDDFWRNSNWSVMALLKFGDIQSGPKEIGVLGHGSADKNLGLHLGISKPDGATDYKVIHGYYSNDIRYFAPSFDNWYHITWTSEKNLQGTEDRCIIINGGEHKCETNTKGRYQGSGTTTIGTWWHRIQTNNLVLDNLIIASGVVRYKLSTNADKQLCYAKIVERNLP